MAQTAERASPAGDALGKKSLRGGFDNSELDTIPPLAQVEIRNSAAVRAVRLELMREAIFENLGAVRLFVETAKILIEASDDMGMAHAVRMGAHHYRAAVVTVKELVALKLKGDCNE